MGKIELDSVLPLAETYTETKHIYRPARCVDCPLFVDDMVGWCTYYKRKTLLPVNQKPDWCKVNAITISEDI